MIYITKRRKYFLYLPNGSISSILLWLAFKVFKFTKSLIQFSSKINYSFIFYSEIWISYKLKQP